jgi:hypothetical protein
MKILVASEKNMEELRNNTKGSLESAKRIWESVKVDYLTAKHIGFTCRDPRYDVSHSIIYYSERKFKRAWNCDCKWFSLKDKFCKHILAVFFRALKDRLFLKNFEKEAVNL